MSQDSLFGGALHGVNSTSNHQDNSDAEMYERFQGSALFQSGADAPLAARMRPADLREVLGQGHLLDEGKPLRKLVEGQGRSSVILYGPPGTGKPPLLLSSLRRWGTISLAYRLWILA